MTCGAAVIEPRTGDFVSRAGRGKLPRQLDELSATELECVFGHSILEGFLGGGGVIIPVVAVLVQYVAPLLRWLEWFLPNMGVPARKAHDSTIHTICGRWRDNRGRRHVS